MKVWEVGENGMGGEREGGTEVEEKKEENLRDQWVGDGRKGGGQYLLLFAPH